VKTSGLTFDRNSGVATTAERVNQSVIHVDQGSKLALLNELLTLFRPASIDEAFRLAGNDPLDGALMRVL